MQSITLRSHIGPDGILHLDVPVGLTNTDLEVMVIIQPSTPATKANTPEAQGWPPGFFERTAGAWQGEPLTRGEQGELVTHNTREFNRVEGLRIEDWEADG